MRHEKEVESSLNALYDAIYGGGMKQLHVRQVSDDMYKIILIVTAEARKISENLVDKYIDGSLEDTETASARKEIIGIFEKLRKPR